MQTAKRSIGPAFLALFVMVMAIPAHAGVYKWVDENGTAHYTDQPPQKGTHTELSLKVAPSAAQPESGNAGRLRQTEPGNIRSLPQLESGNMQNPSNPMQDAHQQRLNEVNARLQAARDRDAAQEKARAEQRRYDDQRAESQKLIDDAVVARCKRNREVYCDKGAKNIRAEEERLRAEAEANANAYRRFVR